MKVLSHPGRGNSEPDLKGQLDETPLDQAHFPAIIFYFAPLINFLERLSTASPKNKSHFIYSSGGPCISHLDLQLCFI